MMKTFTPDELARQGKARLRAKADPKRAAGARKYFKETVEFYGVASSRDPEHRGRPVRDDQEGMDGG